MINECNQALQYGNGYDFISIFFVFIKERQRHESQ